MADSKWIILMNDIQTDNSRSEWIFNFFN